MQMRDALATRETRCVRVLNFLAAVLGGNAHGNLEMAMLTVCRVNDEDRSFADSETFKDSDAHMWFISNRVV